MRRAPVFIGFVALLFATVGSSEETFDMGAFLKETQRASSSPRELRLIWWIPTQFWEASMAKGGADRKKMDEILEVLGRYTMVAVVDGHIGPMGGVTYMPPEAIRQAIIVKDPYGGAHRPLDDAAIDADTRNLLQTARPIVANVLGPTGQNMHFILFPSKTSDGRPIADPMSSGTFTVTLGAADFSYRLPLGSLLPPKYDPKSGEVFPGNYQFNPFTGTSLTTTKPVR
jgi:hypothetical protein